MQAVAAERAKVAPHPGRRTRIIYEAALLVESGRYKSFAGLIVVDAPREERRRRLIERNGFVPELADKIIAAQLDDATRRQAATIVVENAGTLAQLEASVLRVISERGW